VLYRRSDWKELIEVSADQKPQLGTNRIVMDAQDSSFCGVEWMIGGLFEGKLKRDVCGVNRLATTH